MSNPSRAKKLGGGKKLNGSVSGPATQTFGIELGPSQIPSPSVSGSSGSVPVLLVLM